MKYSRFFLLIITLSVYLTASAQEKKILPLPAPQKEIGKPLMQVLNTRHSTRSFITTKPMPLQELSNILWAGFGVNREDGKRTAPSSQNIQDIDIYIFLQSGVYLYNAKENNIIAITGDDLRALTGMQDFVKSAPLNLVYVSDMSKMSKYTDENKLITAGADAGFIAQNIYLYCASQNLGAVIRASVDRKVLAEKLKLKPEQKIILAQTIGYVK
jgi:SagB-type dehydrogenase family enzyme